MKPILRCLLVLVFALASMPLHAGPLRVFFRGGKKTHGPNAHEHERFMKDGMELLAERGAVSDGGMDWPGAEQFQKSDVIVVYAGEAGDATAEQKKLIEEFTQRGGGLVVIHSAAVAMKETDWWKSTIGGSWRKGQTKWKEGPMDLYFTENQQIGGGHPITKGASNFRLDDEIYYDMDISPDVRVLATSYTPNVKEGKKVADGGKVNIYDIQPQMWTYEKGNYRAFVSIPGHLYPTFERPNYRAILLRGVAWAGKRENIDEFCTPDELEALTYPEGGPQKPRDTKAAIELHPDFTIKLVASEPLINKPMNFDWDPAGRLWVAETPEYPNGRRGMRPDYRGKEWKDHGGIDPAPGVQDRKAQDKISILSDTNGDGVMDKKEIFYEGLDLVTGLVFYKDGVIVTQAPDILRLRDTDGDGKADKVEKLYTGLGTGDTHAVINNPRWGWDGWIYAAHGYSASQNVMNAKGEAMPTIGSGVVRFRPDGSAIEQYSSKGGNTWGLEITGDNRVMWTQPTSGQLLMQTVLPEYALARGKVGNTQSFAVVEPSPKSFPLIEHEELPYVQIDWVGSFTAAAGCVIYDGGAWPKEYNGDYFTTEPTINVIHHARLRPQDSSYTAFKLEGREETEFARSKDLWWRPIEVRVAPDGSMFAGDFYNQAVIHNDTRGPDHNLVNAAVRPDRDHYFGRIWKIEHKQQKSVPVPDLSKADAAGLVAALRSENRVTRQTASRLLSERDRPAWKAGDNATALDAAFGYTALVKLATDAKAGDGARIAAMWTLQRQKALGLEVLRAAFSDGGADIRRNGALLAEASGSIPDNAQYRAEIDAANKAVRNGLVQLLDDPDQHVRLAALRALGTRDGTTDDVAQALVAAWPKLGDDHQRSAALGAAMKNPGGIIAAALDSGEAAVLAPLVEEVAAQISSANEAAKLVLTLAAKPASADPIKRAILDALAKNLANPPPLTPQISTALTSLLGGGASASALPLAAKWDKTGELKGAITEIIGRLAVTVNDPKAGDEARIQAAEGLAGLTGEVDGALSNLIKQLTAEGSAAFKRALIGLLAGTNDGAVGAALSSAYPGLPADVQPAAFDALLQRAPWANSFLDAIESKKVNPAALGPAAASRLRTHPNRRVARRANTLLDQVNPMAEAKKEAIAKLAPVVAQPGNVETGKTLFNATCAVCHKFNDIGADIGPGLMGMGSHGAGELLSAIIDPNAEVDPSFSTWNIESKDGQLYAGIIATENPASITLKSLVGVQEIKTAAIKSRVNTGRSLMPEGFEGLGGEALRDMIAYMQSVDGGRFRTLDLRGAFTANSGRGIYTAEDNEGDTLKFAKTGTVNVEGVPFNIVPPGKAAKNVIVLKGGKDGSVAKSMPRKVEAPVGGFKANRLHFLGGVAGWGYPAGGREGEVLVKVTVEFAGGERESFELKNGVEFADYIREVNVPGSKLTKGLVKENQLRWFTKTLERTAPIAKLTLESSDSGAAPTIVAITAELADANAAKPAAASAAAAAPAPGDEDAAFKPQFDEAVPQPPAERPAKGPRVLLVGGGSSHDFVKFFGETDKKTLADVAGWVDFTQNANGVPAILDRVDVLVWSANQPISSKTRKALIDFANSGKGIVPFHPGTWYAWKNFPQWNKEVVGGGTRGHDALGPFEVSVTAPGNPVVAGVAPKFGITDELYNYKPDPAGTPIEVLATAKSPKSGNEFPQVFIVKHPRSRIVAITLGHDARAHDLPDFQTILRQAVAWAGGK